MEEILNLYYENNARKLRQTVDRIVNRKFGATLSLDMEEYYSTANETFADIIKNNRYDQSKGKFDNFLYGALSLAVIDEYKRQHCDKRMTKIELLDQNGNQILDDKGLPKKISIRDVYLDAPMETGSDLTIGDALSSDYCMEDELLNALDEKQGNQTEKYLNSLPKIQRQIVEMKMNGIAVSEIKNKLALSGKQYERHCKALKSFANVNILFRSERQSEYKEDKREMSSIHTMENCKTDRISVASIIKKIDKHTIRFDHALQRESDQWSPAMKGNLVSDILQGNKLHPLIFAEQIINGAPIIWDLDGKQRCTNAYLFAKNGYKTSKNIRRYLIQYQTIKKDKKGNDVLDENGFPIAVNKEFDIRGKKFSDLPEELQDRFLDYSFNYDQYLNCTEEDIAYHIERYNDGKPMSSSQKGITKLGAEFAEKVKSISNMSFFKDIGAYKACEFRNGTINRVVVESVMSVNYFDKWNKLDEMCKYIKDNASADVFEEFEYMAERLEKVVTDEASVLFNSKDSFLWFGLFAKFAKTKMEDKKFNEFLKEFVQTLHSKSIGGKSFDQLVMETKSTKDKGIVTKKMQHLEKLMNLYLSISQN